ncbi:MAG: prepilin-type N-terminal cleavage/methylation domain-containing protein [Rubinisphaera brasiliensis]|uniref:type IV pilus modification PilV family protein n=1 Tax=Rubinisphaera brasiliensis TaxID=119 RepID=UPI0039191BAF
MSQSKLKHIPDRYQAGFTLIEVLVAVGLIVLLAGLLLATMRGVLGNAKESSTRVTLKKIQEILEQRATEFNIAESNAPASRRQEPCLPVDADSGLKSIVERKRKFREAFPQRYQDLYDAFGNRTRLGQVFDVKYLSKAPSGVDETNLDSAELLYLVVNEGTAHGSEATDSDQFGAQEVTDTDGDSFPEFVDAWGQPLRFYRWPTRLIRPGTPATPATPLSLDSTKASLPAVETEYWLMLGSKTGDINTLSRDQEDPTSAIYRMMGADVASIQSVEFDSTPPDTCSFHTPDTYTAFLVLSGGPDLQIGLYEPDDTANFGHLAQPKVALSDLGNNDDTLSDDITNLQGID